MAWFPDSPSTTPPPPIYTSCTGLLVYEMNANPTDLKKSTLITDPKCFGIKSDISKAMEKMAESNNTSNDCSYPRKESTTLLSTLKPATSTTPKVDESLRRFKVLCFGYTRIHDPLIKPADWDAKSNISVDGIQLCIQQDPKFEISKTPTTAKLTPDPKQALLGVGSTNIVFTPVKSKTGQNITSINAIVTQPPEGVTYTANLKFSSGELTKTEVFTKNGTVYHTDTKVYPKGVNNFKGGENVSVYIRIGTLNGVSSIEKREGNIETKGSKIKDICSLQTLKHVDKDYAQTVRVVDADGKVTTNTTRKNKNTVRKFEQIRVDKGLLNKKVEAEAGEVKEDGKKIINHLDDDMNEGHKIGVGKIVKGILGIRDDPKTTVNSKDAKKAKESDESRPDQTFNDYLKIIQSDITDIRANPEKDIFDTQTLHPYRETAAKASEAWAKNNVTWLKYKDSSVAFWKVLFDVAKDDFPGKMYAFAKRMETQPPKIYIGMETLAGKIKKYVDEKWL